MFVVQLMSVCVCFIMHSEVCFLTSGALFGSFHREVATFPVRTNQIPRAIPQQQWYLHPVISCLLGGILPFGAVSVELYFIMSALWLHQVHQCDFSSPPRTLPEESINWPCCF